MGMVLIGYVIMPAHIHLLLHLHRSDQVAVFLRDFKSFTAKRITRQAIAEGRRDLLDMFQQAGALTNRAEFKIRQDDYWDRTIRSNNHLRNTLRYIHNNPVRRGIVTDPGEYPFSSYSNYQGHRFPCLDVKRARVPTG